MKIVIDIDKQDYEMACKYPYSLISVKAHVIKNGTPLPKGHGDLIDRSQIKWFGCDFESFENCHIVNDDCSICSHATCLHDDVMSLPKIVPADKEDAEC